MSQPAAMLLLATLMSAAQAHATDAMLKAGRTSFESKCAMCHAMSKGEPHGAGPNLSGVLGRRIGSADGFAYSQALASKTEVWDAISLNTFLQDPQKFAPGTAMPFAGLKSEKERKALACFLGADANGAACK